MATLATALTAQHAATSAHARTAFFAFVARTRAILLLQARSGSGTGNRLSEVVKYLILGTRTAGELR